MLVRKSKNKIGILQKTEIRIKKIRIKQSLAAERRAGDQVHFMMVTRLKTHSRMKCCTHNRKGTLQNKTHQNSEVVVWRLQNMESFMIVGQLKPESASLFLPLCAITAEAALLLLRFLNLWTWPCLFKVSTHHSTSALVLCQCQSLG